MHVVFCQYYSPIQETHHPSGEQRLSYPVSSQQVAKISNYKQSEHRTWIQSRHNTTITLVSEKKWDLKQDLILRNQVGKKEEEEEDREKLVLDQTNDEKSVRLREIFVHMQE